ncbi:MAG: hypothetical protein ACREJ2_04645 [Planctomycetota bacterium]
MELDLQTVSLLLAMAAQLASIAWYLASLRAEIRLLKEQMQPLASKLELQASTHALRQEMRDWIEDHVAQALAEREDLRRHGGRTPRRRGNRK